MSNCPIKISCRSKIILQMGTHPTECITWTTTVVVNTTHNRRVGEIAETKENRNMHMIHTTNYAVQQLRLRRFINIARSRKASEAGGRIR